MREKIIATRSTWLGEDHPDTIRDMEELALKYWNQTRWGKAESLFVRVMQARLRTLGEPLA